MPNHVTNRLIVTGEQDKIEEFFNSIKGGNGSLIDFEKLIPMPDDIFRGNLSMEDQKRTMGRNWYDWSIENWGTKWNAYSQHRVDNTLYFDTAWATPTPIIKEIARKFPEFTIDYAYADEDYGNNIGIGILKDGNLSMFGGPEENSREARLLFLEVKRETAESYGVDPFTLEFEDEEED